MASLHTIMTQPCWRAQATRTVTVPGATNLQVIVEYDTEPTYDNFQAADETGAVITSVNGADVVRLDIVGSTVTLGVTSDESVSSAEANFFGTTYAGYRILGITYE